MLLVTPKIDVYQLEADVVYFLKFKKLHLKVAKLMWLDLILCAKLIFNIKESVYSDAQNLFANYLIADNIWPKKYLTQEYNVMRLRPQKGTPKNPRTGEALLRKAYSNGATFRRNWGRIAIFAYGWCKKIHSRSVEFFGKFWFSFKSRC